MSCKQINQVKPHLGLYIFFFAGTVYFYLSNHDERYSKSSLVVFVLCFFILIPHLIYQSLDMHDMFNEGEITRGRETRLKIQNKTEMLRFKVEPFSIGKNAT